ncbi:unnamed protein product [Arctogadus glacialis]
MKSEEDDGSMRTELRDVHSSLFQDGRCLATEKSSHFPELAVLQVTNQAHCKELQIFQNSALFLKIRPQERYNSL